MQHTVSCDHIVLQHYYNQKSIGIQNKLFKLVCVIVTKNSYEY